MLEKLRAAAMEKLASKDEVDAFMDGFEKEAFNFAALGQLASNPKVQESLIRAGTGLGAGLLGAAIVKSISSGYGAISSYNTRGKFESALNQVMTNNKIVKGANPVRAKDYAETLYRFAPHIASDPNLLNSILANAVLGEGIDPQTIKTLVELESRFMENHSTSPLAGIRV